MRYRRPSTFRVLTALARYRRSGRNARDASQRRTSLRLPRSCRRRVRSRSCPSGRGCSSHRRRPWRGSRPPDRCPRRRGLRSCLDVLCPGWAGEKHGQRQRGGERPARRGRSVRERRCADVFRRVMVGGPSALERAPARASPIPVPGGQASLECCSVRRSCRYMEKRRSVCMPQPPPRVWCACSGTP